jgi:hypothetical protein
VSPLPEPTPRRAPEPAGEVPLVARLRGVHLEMVDAVLGGDGLGRVASLAAAAAGAPVAVVVPRLGVQVAGGACADASLRVVARYVTDRLRDRPARVPETVVAEVPIAAGDDVLGAAVLLDGPGDPDPHAAEFLHFDRKSVV